MDNNSKLEIQLQGTFHYFPESLDERQYIEGYVVFHIDFKDNDLETVSISGEPIAAGFNSAYDFFEDDHGPIEFMPHLGYGLSRSTSWIVSPSLFCDVSLRKVPILYRDIISEKGVLIPHMPSKDNPGVIDV